MKYSLKCLFLSLVFALCAFGVARFCHHQTKGFRLSKIANNMHAEPQHLSPEEIALVRSLFAYRFHYLGRGLQSFVFLSEDGEHVLKVFINTQKRKSALFQALSPLPFLSSWAKERALHAAEKSIKTFSSYQLAFTEMKHRSGLVFLHLGPSTSRSLPPVTLVDPLHIVHRVDSNTLGFLIQKKAKLVYPALAEWIEAEDLDKAKRALCSLLDLLFWKSAQGIHDNDPLLRTNFGFLEEEAIQIDVGPLSKDFTPAEPEKMQRELQRITASLKNWLTDHSPPLAHYLEEEWQKRLK